MTNLNKIIAASLLCLATLPVKASLLDLKWNEQAKYEHTTEIKAGGMLELCGQLEAGIKIDWQYQSSQALDFNIHFHEGKAVNMPVKFKGKAELQAQFEVKQTQGYCWMWTNKTGEKASLRILLARLN